MLFVVKLRTIEIECVGQDSYQFWYACTDHDNELIPLRMLRRTAARILGVAHRGRLEEAAQGPRRSYPRGRMFWLWRKTLPGSNLALSFRSRP